jgi:phenylacetate-CoA ligase
MDTARIWRIPELIRKHPGLYKLKRWPSRVLTLDAANLGEQEINEFLQQWQKIRPEVLCGYVGGVDYVANFVLDKGCDLPPPRIVWLTAAPVTNVQRTTIRKAFRAPVYDQYACSEILYIAAECEYQNGLHVSSDYRHVEILNDNGEPCDVGEEGNVVVTDLENYVFPLIRYVTGDRASWMKETCECGRSLPLMSPVKGRVSEIIRLPSGKAISGEYLTTIFDDYPSAVRTFRVVQNRDHSLHVEYVPRNSEAIKAVQKVRHALEEIIQGEVRVSFICKEEIDNDRGKIRYITSELDTKNPGMPQA